MSDSKLLTPEERETKRALLTRVANTLVGCRPHNGEPEWTDGGMDDAVEIGLRALATIDRAEADHAFEIAYVNELLGAQEGELIGDTADRVMAEVKRLKRAVAQRSEDAAKGGRQRAKNQTPAQRSAQARNAANARWGNDE